MKLDRNINYRNVIVSVILILIGFIIGVAGTLIIVIRAGHSLF